MQIHVQFYCDGVGVQVQDTSGDAAKCRTLATYGSDIYMYM